MGTYVLQMGHVPRTRGSTGAPGEQGYNEAVCNAAARMLRDRGHVVHVIPADPLSYPRGDVFVAVHYDGSDSPSARGASVGYRDEAGQREAHKWKVAYQRAGFSGGFRGDNYTRGLSGYYGTGRSNCDASYILEGGFGSHPIEGPWLRSAEGINTCARAIVMALTGYNPPPKEDAVTPGEIESIARAVWSQDLNGKPAGNRATDTDVRGEQNQDALARLASLFTKTFEGRNVARDLRGLRRGVRAVLHAVGVSKERLHPDDDDFINS